MALSSEIISIKHLINTKKMKTSPKPSQCLQAQQILQIAASRSLCLTMEFLRHNMLCTKELNPRINTLKPWLRLKPSTAVIIKTEIAISENNKNIIIKWKIYKPTTNKWNLPFNLQTATMTSKNKQSTCNNSTSSKLIANRLLSIRT